MKGVVYAAMPSNTSTDAMTKASVKNAAVKGAINSSEVLCCVEDKNWFVFFKPKPKAFLIDNEDE